jgi:hypothetical protein
LPTAAEFSAVNVTVICDPLLELCPEAATPWGRLSVGEFPKPEPEIVTWAPSSWIRIFDGEMDVIVGAGAGPLTLALVSSALSRLLAQGSSRCRYIRLRLRSR